MINPSKRSRTLFSLIAILGSGSETADAFETRPPKLLQLSTSRRETPAASRIRSILVIDAAFYTTHTTPRILPSYHDVHRSFGILKASSDSVPQSELVLEDDDEDDDTEQSEWIPDMVKARQKRQNSRIHVQRVPTESSADPTNSQTEFVDETPSTSSSPYTEEEEEVIAAMGGKSFHRNRRQRREEGYLGDSSLQEIAQDYSIPICYLADVLCVWGVPPPIHIHDRLGDLVTGEQAFSLLEAVNSLDVSAVQDRYSNQNLLTLCDEWNMDLQTAFEFCMKEGWSLPFGVQTCLRVEQEDELLRVHASLR